MGRILKKTRAVLRLFDTSLDGEGVKREDTHIIVLGDGKAEVRLFLRSCEVSGVWVMRYDIAPWCLHALRVEALVEHRGDTAEGTIFVLSQKGRERLGVS